MRTEELATSYAKAIYEAAFETWLLALRQVRDGLHADAQLAFLLTDPGKDDEAKRPIVKALLPAGGSAEMENFVLLLARNGHLGMLEEISQEFGLLVTFKQERVAALVTTAVPLTAAEKAAMQQQLSQHYGDRLDFEYAIDPEILGGVIVRVAGKVIDDSVAGRLAALRTRLGVSSR